MFSGAQSDAILHSYKASAVFASAPDGTAGDFTVSTVGPCEIRIYKTLPSPGTPMKEDAGIITITGGKKPVTLTPDAKSVYADAKDNANDLFDGGETLTITAAGAMVPAFTTDAVAPAHVDITLPLEPPNKGPLPLDRTKDLVLTWNNGGAGDLVALLSDGKSTKLTCTFPTAPGTGTVPQAALATLAPGSMGGFLLGAASTKNVTAGDWTVLVLVGSSFTWNGVVNPQTFSYQASN